MALVRPPSDGRTASTHNPVTRSTDGRSAPGLPPTGVGAGAGWVGGADCDAAVGCAGSAAVGTAASRAATGVAGAADVEPGWTDGAEVDRGVEAPGRGGGGDPPLARRAASSARAWSAGRPDGRGGGGEAGSAPGTDGAPPETPDPGLGSLGATAAATGAAATGAAAEPDATGAGGAATPPAANVASRRSTRAMRASIEPSAPPRVSLTTATSSGIRGSGD